MVLEVSLNQGQLDRISPRDAFASIPYGAKEFVPLLIEILKEDRSQFGRLSVGASRALVRIGPVAADDLVKSLGQPEIARVLEMIGPEAAPSLLDGLKSRSATVRHEAAFLLVHIGPEAEKAIPILLDEMRSKDSIVRSNAVSVLLQLGPKVKRAIPELVGLLKDRDPVLRTTAGRILHGIGSQAKDAIPSLIQSLKDEKQDVRLAAAMALLAIDPNQKAAIPVLRDLLGDGNKGGANQKADRGFVLLLDQIERANEGDATYRAWTRLTAGDALLLTEGQTDAVLPSLVDLLKHEEWYIRKEAAKRIGGMGPKAKAAADPLRAALRGQIVPRLRDVDAIAIIQAAEALWKVDGRGEAVVPTLMEALKHEHWRVRADAAELLGRIGPAAKEAIPVLTDALNDRDPSSGLGYVKVRLDAAEAIWKVDHRADLALAVLLDQLNNSTDYFYRRKAARVLGTMGPAAKEAIPSLVKSLQRNDKYGYGYPYSEYRSSRDAPYEALANLGPVAQSAVPALIDALKDTDPFIRLKAAEAIWKIDKKSNAVVTVTIELLKARSALVRERAGEVLGLMGSKSKQAIPELVEALHDEYAEVAAQSAITLGEIGPDAKAAFLPLAAAYKNKDSEVRQAAAAALKRIDPKAASKEGIQ
jgi:HEAT repeat protein